MVKCVYYVIVKHIILVLVKPESKFINLHTKSRQISKFLDTFSTVPKMTVDVNGHLSISTKTTYCLMVAMQFLRTFNTDRFRIDQLFAIKHIIVNNDR